MAKITKEIINGVNYLRAGNLLISDSEYRTNEFKFIYESKASESSPGKIYTHSCRPVDPDNKDHISSLHRLWFSLKDTMEKAKKDEDIMPYGVLKSLGGVLIKKTKTPATGDKIIVEEESVVENLNKPARVQQMSLFSSHRCRAQRVLKSYFKDSLNCAQC